MANRDDTWADVHKANIDSNKKYVIDNNPR